MAVAAFLGLGCLLYYLVLGRRRQEGVRWKNEPLGGLSGPISWKTIDPELAAWRDLSRKHFVFFRNLNEEEQLEFVRRCRKVRSVKQFRVEAGIELDEEKILLLCGTLVMLTFGLRSEHYLLPRFQVIKIYPAIFYSRLVGENVKGLTYGKGVVHLSWPDFTEGFSDEKDKVNLGLHEFAHAYMIELDHFTGNEDYADWMKLAVPVIRQMKEGSELFFRAYGSTNEYEFWAVCVETIFEAPLEFRNKFPPLYQATAALLGQDLAVRYSSIHSTTLVYP